MSGTVITFLALRYGVCFDSLFCPLKKADMLFKHVFRCISLCVLERVIVVMHANCVLLFHCLTEGEVMVFFGLLTLSELSESC